MTAQEVLETARRFLDERGLSITDGKYIPATADRLTELGMATKENARAALVIPYHDVKGAPTDFYRLRWLEAGRGMKARKDSEQRYTQPAVSPRVYFPPKFNFNRFFALPAHEREPLSATEGELKADAAVKHGIPCIALGGCWNFRTTRTDPASGEKFVELLPELAHLPWEGMDVHICFDSDSATNVDVLRARDDLAERLEALGARIFIRSLPQLKRGTKTGLDDYLKEKGKKAFLALPLERWYGPNTPALLVRTKDSFLNHEYKDREPILQSDAACFLRHPSIVQVHAWRGTGKTHVTACLAAALTHKGGHFFRWHTVRPLRVLYVDGEQPGCDGQEVVRLQAKDAPSANFYYLTLEDQPTFRIPKIVTHEGQKALERAIEENQIEVLVLDSLSTLANVAMNEEQNQLAMSDWFIRLRTGLRVTVIYCQHDGKTGQQRGHSKHEDWIDLSIHLQSPSKEYDGVQGLRAHFIIDKARRPITDGQPMKISLGPSLKDPKRSEWFYANLSDAEKKSGDLVDAATLLLYGYPTMSDNKLKEALRARGMSVKNDKKTAEALRRARELRAKADAPTTPEGDPSRKKPKYAS